MTMITNSLDVMGIEKKRAEPTHNNYFYNGTNNNLNTSTVSSNGDNTNSGGSAIISGNLCINNSDMGEMASNYQHYHHNQQQFLTSLPAQFYKSLLAKAVLADEQKLQWNESVQNTNGVTASNNGAQNLVHWMSMMADRMDPVAITHYMPTWNSITETNDISSRSSNIRSSSSSSGSTVIKEDFQTNQLWPPSTYSSNNETKLNAVSNTYQNGVYNQNLKTADNHVYNNNNNNNSNSQQRSNSNSPTQTNSSPQTHQLPNTNNNSNNTLLVVPQPLNSKLQQIVPQTTQVQSQGQSHLDVTNRKYQCKMCPQNLSAMLNEGPMAGANNDYLQRSLDSLRSAAAVDFRFNFVTNGSPTPSFVAAAAAANHHYATSGAPAFFYTNRNNVIIEPSDLRFFGGGVPAVTTGVETSTATATTTTNSNENIVKNENHVDENGTAGEESIESSSTTPSPVSVGESATASNQNSYDDDKAFISKAEMQIHQQAHMREAKPYKCSQCCKAFANSSYLSQHTRIHLGIKPYRCEICQRKFTQLSHLQQHIRTHTGDKPYKCRHPGCQKAFSQLSNLQSHSRCHQTDKPYKCNSCYKCFSDENALLDHIPKHKESKHLKTHICQFCGKSYTQETYLNKHLQKHTERPPDKPQHHQQRPQLSSASAIAAVAAAAAAGGLNLNAAHHHHHHHRNLLGTGSHHPGLEHHPYWSKLSPESGATPENLHDYSSELQRQIIEQQQQQQQQHVQQQNDEMLRQQQQSPSTSTLSNTNYDNVNKVMTSSAFTPISVMSQMPSNQLQLNNRILTNTSSGPAYLYDPISFQKNNSPATPQNPLDLNKSSQTSSTSTSNNTGGQSSTQTQENAPPQQQNNTPAFAVNNHLISLHQIRSYQQHPTPQNSNGTQNSLDHNGMLVGGGGGPLKDKN